MELAPRIVRAVPHDDHTVTLTFSNGEQRMFDMRPYLDAPVFRPLHDLGLFKQVRIDVLGSLVWPGERDLAYDMLYAVSASIAVADSKEA